MSAAATPWSRVKVLLHEAMQLPSPERQAFLEGACAGNGALRAELESLLLAGDALPSAFLSSPAQVSGEEADELNPDEIFAHNFRLIRELGEGGMGQVWLAEQIAPVRRQVALKLIKAGLYDASVVQRFEAERQSLAVMDHPAIAKVFDAGNTDRGQPYFVMEYVPGFPSRSIATATSRASANDWSSSSSRARVSSTRISARSSIAISNRRTSSSSRWMARPCRASSTSGSPRPSPPGTLPPNR